MTEISTAPATRKFPLFLTVFFAVFLALVAAFFVVKWVYFPKAFTPVTLSSKEEAQLEQKLRVLGIQVESPSTSKHQETLKPEPYRELDEKRLVAFSEDEINSLIAKNPQWANRLAIDFSDSLASAKLLIPLDPDFPLLGGQTLRINTGVDIQFANGKPSVRLEGVSLWGVPLPNAWLGNLKHVDLVEQYGQEDGFWRSFAQGVEHVSVEDGRLVIKLNK